MRATTCLTICALSVGALVATDAGAFQFYAPWTGMGDADGWYSIGPDGTKGYTPPVKPGASSTSLKYKTVASPEFYGVVTTRNRTVGTAFQRFVTVESRSISDEAARGCTGTRYADLGMPTISGLTNNKPPLVPGAPYWTSTPALAHDWVFVTVLDSPSTLDDFMFHGHVYAKHRQPKGADLCRGWDADWTDLGTMTPRWVGSAPSALTIPAGEPGAGTTYVCTDVMHGFDAAGGILCRHTRDNVNFSAWQMIATDNNLNYVVGRPSMTYDLCTHKLLFAAVDASDRRYFYVMHANIDPASGDLRLPTGTPGSEPSLYNVIVGTPGTWELAGTPALSFAHGSCDLNLVVRIAQRVDLRGARVTDPVQYTVARHPAGTRLDIGWVWSGALDTGNRSVGVPSMLPSQTGAVMILDHNHSSRQYWQWFEGPGGTWSSRRLYDMGEPPAFNTPQVTVNISPTATIPPKMVPPPAPPPPPPAPPPPPKK